MITPTALTSGTALFNTVATTMATSGEDPISWELIMLVGIAAVAAVVVAWLVFGKGGSD